MDKRLPNSQEIAGEEEEEEYGQQCAKSSV